MSDFEFRIADLKTEPKRENPNSKFEIRNSKFTQGRGARVVELAALEML